MIRIINNGATGAIINLRGYDREIYVFFLKSELYNGKYLTYYCLKMLLMEKVSPLHLLEIIYGS